MDADWATDSLDRKSQSGHTLLLNNGAVTWVSKKQSVTAQSSCEAELIASVAATNELKWFSQVAAALQVPISRPFVLNVDNTVAITANSHETSGARLKHVEIKYFIMKQYLDSGLLRLRHVPTKDQTADILTKCLDHVLLARHHAALGLVPLNDTNCPAATQVHVTAAGSDGVPPPSTWSVRS